MGWENKKNKKVPQCGGVKDTPDFRFLSLISPRFCSEGKKGKKRNKKYKKNMVRKIDRMK
jgi:hypothetical protein